ncbi:MAG: outer membrane protein assembly factor BamB [Verrucomicrobiales bacterium]|jgi:outer membrane protein assembly factor BamB
MKMKLISILSATFFAASSCWAGDWLNFRGPDGSGIADASEKPVTEFKGDDSIAWKLELPGRGLSSPVVVGDRVFVTSSSGPTQKQLHVFCVSAENGEVLWERRFWATGRTMTHGKTNVAAPSPCSDGKHIFALFSSNDLICLDLDGNLKWLRGLTFDYPNASNSLGMASSPIYADGALIVQSENDSESFAAGIDVVTGQNLWKKVRPKAANWTSPTVIAGEQVVVALQSSKGVLGVLPKTGSEIFDYKDGASTIPSSAAAGGVLFVPSHGITALKPNAKGGEPEQLWRNGQLGPGTGSPLVIGENIYVVNKAGVLSQAKISDGERGWRARTEGPYSGSPIAAGNFIYLFNEQGKGQIVDVTKGEEGNPVSSIELEETILCTPAFSGGAIYVRSDGHLWKLK